MALKKIMFRVLLSSASDVKEERDIVSKIVSELNDTYKDTPFGIELFRWENDVSPSITLENGQKSIDKKFNYRQADLLIGIFYKKLGVGTVHEINEAIEVKRELDLLDIKLYFKKVDKNTLNENEEEQYKELNAKKNEYMKQGIVGNFDHSDDFCEKCRKHITDFFNNAKKMFLREQPESQIKNKFISEFPEVPINSFKMCYYRNEVNKGMSQKTLAQKAGTSARKIGKYEKISGDGGTLFFPTCPIKELLKIEEALSVNFGGLIGSDEIMQIIDQKEYYDRFKTSSHIQNNIGYKAIVFDFDGTLADAKQMKTTWQKIWSALGYDLKICENLHSKFDRKDISHQTWCNMTADYFIKKNMNHDQLIDIAKTIHLVEGFEETITILREHKIALYIVSGSIKEIINYILGDFASSFNDISANEMIFDENGYLISIKGTQFDFSGKAEYIRRLVDNNSELSPKQILFIGNSFNDAHVYKSGCRTLCVNPHLTNSHNTKYWHERIDNMENLLEILPYCHLN